MVAPNAKLLIEPFLKGRRILTVIVETATERVVTKLTDTILLTSQNGNNGDVADRWQSIHPIDNPTIRHLPFGPL